jgi:glycyl-tRNA synthetase beta chain
MPASMGDAIPQRVEAQVVGLADRFTTIVQMFRIGLQPTGSKDPFALRRAGNGVVKLLAESSLPLTLEYLFQTSILDASGQSMTVISDKLYMEIKRFFNERIAFYLRDTRGFSHGVVSGVMKAHGTPVSNVAAASIVVHHGETFINNVRHAVLRAEALTEVSGSKDFADVAAAFKRTKNILAQARERQEAIPDVVNRELLLEPAEKDLYEEAATAVAKVEQYRSRGTKEGYVEALKKIAALRPQVDAFFDAVMVIAPEREIRANRLALLQWLLGSFFRIADFSEIVVAG